MLEYNCFTMLCYFLLYNNVNQLDVYIAPLLLEPLSHLAAHQSLILITQVAQVNVKEANVLQN